MNEASNSKSLLSVSLILSFFLFCMNSVYGQNQRPHVNDPLFYRPNVGADGLVNCFACYGTGQIKNRYQIKCRRCNGSAVLQDANCQTCNGQGNVKVMRNVPGYVSFADCQICPMCDGRGKESCIDCDNGMTMVYKDERCRFCDGKGRTTEVRSENGYRWAVKRMKMNTQEDLQRVERQSLEMGRWLRDQNDGPSLFEY